MTHTAWIALLLSFASGTAFAEVPAEELSQEDLATRAELDASLANWEEILTKARAVPHSENGQPAGFIRVNDAAPGSVYEKVQLRNSEMITTTEE